MGIFRVPDLENHLNRLIASRDRCFAGDSPTCWAKEGLTLRTGGYRHDSGLYRQKLVTGKSKYNQVACALSTMTSQFSENLTPNEKESLDCLLKCDLKAVIELK